MVEPDALRQALAAFLGEERFRKFVSQGISRGRLRFWQQEEWRRFTASHPEFAVDLEELAVTLCPAVAPVTEHEQERKDRHVDVPSLLQDLTSAFRQHRPGPADVGTLIALYGSATTLSALVKQIRGIIARDVEVLKRDGATPVLSKVEEQVFVRLFREFRSFSEIISSLSLSVLDIYYPGISTAFYSVMHHDFELGAFYNNVLVKRYGLDRHRIPSAIAHFLLDGFGWTPHHAFELLGHEIMGQEWARSRALLWSRLPTEDSREATQVDAQTIERMNTLCNTIEEFSKLVSAVVRENWTFREVADGPQNPLPPLEVTMGDKFTNVDTQVGAQGSHSKAQDVMQQMWQQSQAAVDLAALSAELATLRKAMRKEAEDPSHDKAVADVGAAEEAAKMADGPSVLKHLKSAGKWALDVATKIGVSLASDMIKKSLSA